MHGICHIEIPSKDFEKAAAFYKAVFDWETQMIPQMNYAMYKAPSGVNGGFSGELEIYQKPGVVFYIEVENIDASLKKIEKNGGKTIKGKTEIAPEMGFYAIFGDAEGNTLGLWAQK